MPTPAASYASLRKAASDARLGGATATTTFTTGGGGGSIGTLKESKSSWTKSDDRLSRASTGSTRSYTVPRFIVSWGASKRVYYTLQLVFLLLNMLLTVLTVGVCLWINIDPRWRVLTALSNQLAYTSLNRLIGLLPFVFILVSSSALFLDTSQTILFVYLHRFLEAHDSARIARILVNQSRIDRLDAGNIEHERHCLEARMSIKHRMRVITSSLEWLTYLTYSAYALLVIAPLFYMGIQLHYSLTRLLSYELPMSMQKLVKTYEQQQLARQVARSTRLVNIALTNVRTGSVEEALVDEMNVHFRCCNYQNPFNYGDLVPPSCRMDIGCLRPMQAWAWYCFYIGVIALLVAGSLKVALQLLLFVNYRWLLVKRLIQRLYFAEITHRHSRSQSMRSHRLEEANAIGTTAAVAAAESTELIETSSGEETQRNEEARRKLNEIRRLKELRFKREEEEEEAARAKQEAELQQRRDMERRQEEYERRLLAANRFDEFMQQRQLRNIEHKVHKAQQQQSDTDV